MAVNKTGSIGRIERVKSLEEDVPSQPNVVGSKFGPALPKAPNIITKRHGNSLWAPGRPSIESFVAQYDNNPEEFFDKITNYFIEDSKHLIATE